MRLYRYLAQHTGMQSTIVHSLDGYDEISLTSPFKIVTNADERVYTPQDLGFRDVRPDDLYGGDTVADAAEIFLGVLRGETTRSRREVVIANAACALTTLDSGLTLDDALHQARESLLTGRAFEAFKTFVKINSNGLYSE